MKKIFILIILIIAAIVLDSFIKTNTEIREQGDVAQETTQVSSQNQSETSSEAVSEQETETDTNQEQETMKAIFTTNQGTFEIELFNELAPNTVDNFVKLAESGFYSGVKFHRVIKGFMIQGGDPNTKDDELMDVWGTGGPGYTFDDEIHAENRNVIGSISMANAGPNTNGSQFFINTADNDFLDTKHTVFGKIVAGMDVITTIENTETGFRDVPVEPMIIESITIEK